MASLDAPGIDPVTGKMYAEFVPAGYPTTAEMTAAINASGVTQAALDAINASIANTPIMWHSVSGAYPPHPATTRPLWFDDPALQPTNDGNPAGGGGMVPGVDRWVSA